MLRDFCMFGAATLLTGFGFLSFFAGAMMFMSLFQSITLDAASKSSENAINARSEVRPELEE